MQPGDLDELSVALERPSGQKHFSASKKFPSFFCARRPMEAMNDIGRHLMLKVWSGSLGQSVAHIGDKSNGPAVCVALHADGKQVVAGFHSGSVRLYDIITGTVYYPLTDMWEALFITMFYSGFMQIDVFVFSLTICELSRGDIRYTV